MNWIYLALALGLLVSVCFTLVVRADNKRYNDNYRQSYVGVAIGAFLAPVAVVAFFGSLMYSLPYNEREPHRVTLNSETSLVSLADGQGVRGSFFLGSGSVNSKPAYYFYVSTGPGRFKQDYVYADGVEIVEQEGPAKLKKYDCHWNSTGWQNEETRTDCKIEFVVPNGTVVPGYVLDTSAK